MRLVASFRLVQFAPGLVFAAVLALFAPTAQAATKVVTDDDKGADIHINAGDALEVHLKADTSDGERWYVHPRSTALLRLTAESKSLPSDAGGASIIQVFSFQSHRKGDGILILRYAPPGQKPFLGEQQFTLHVVIDEPSSKK